MPSAIELIDGRSVSFNEGAVEATKAFILEGYASEDEVIFNAFDNSVATIGATGGETTVIPRIGSVHPLLNVLFCYAYQLDQLPGESDKWKAVFRYRRTPAASSGGSTGSIGTGPADVGFEELSARVSGSFAEQYRSDPGSIEPGVDVGGSPIDRAGVPTSVMRTQMEISLARTMSVFDPGSFAVYVGTRNSQSLFGLAKGTLVYRGANISRQETNKFTVQHTWLYDSQSHMIQTPTYNLDGTPKLGKEDDQYKGKAFPVYHEQPFPEGDSHTLLNSF